MKNYLASVFVFLSIVSSGSVSGAPSQEEIENQMEAAYRAYHGFQDVTGALAIYRELAQGGYAPAQTRLALILDLGGNDVKAVEWYRKAAEQNDTESQLLLAQHLATGDGVEQDESLALHWLERAAEAEDSQAMMALAMAYAEGQLGLAKDEQKAVLWLQRAGEKGNVNAASQLYESYTQGTLGLAPDPQKASYWLKRRSGV